MTASACRTVFLNELEVWSDVILERHMKVKLQLDWCRGIHYNSKAVMLVCIVLFQLPVCHEACTWIAYASAFHLCQ